MTGWQQVHTWLLGYLPTLTGLTNTVFDGAVLTRDDMTAYAIVGDDGEGNAGFFEQDYDLEPMVSETGEVNVRLIGRTGETDLSAVRDAAKAWVDSLRAAVAADKTLDGLLSQGSTVSVGRVDVRQLQTKAGALVDFLVSVRYFTRF